MLLTRLLGRLSPSRLGTGTGPNDRRLIPDVDILDTCLAPTGVSSEAAVEVVAIELVALPVVRFLLSIVTLGGM